jgi:hypothetical protein
MATIGERALAWSLDQMAAENPPSHDRVAEWFVPAERGGRPLGLTSGNHCAVGASAAAFQACGTHCDAVPHGYRAGAKELAQDAQRAGAWVQRGEAFIPSPGDLAVYHRGDVDSWLGHVNRVVSADESGFAAIGANEGAGGAWAINNHAYDQSNLMGFVHYPQVQVMTTARIVGISLLVATLGYGAVLVWGKP